MVDRHSHGSRDESTQFRKRERGMMMMVGAETSADGKYLQGKEDIDGDAGSIHAKKLVLGGPKGQRGSARVSWARAEKN